MSTQQDAIETFLDAYKGVWFTTKEISVGMGVPYGLIGNALGRMRRWGTVQYDSEHHVYRRIRLRIHKPFNIPSVILAWVKEPFGKGKPPRLRQAVS